jgi:hypothetical protein
MKTLLTILIAFLLLAPAALFAQDNGRIKVTVLDEHKQPMIGVVVRIIAGGPVMGGQTQLDGTWTFAGLIPGSYDVEARIIGYKRYVKSGIQVAAGQTAYAEYPMILSNDTLEVFTVTAVQSPVDPTFTSIENINTFAIKHAASAKGDIAGLVTNTSTQVTTGKGGGLVMRGSREGASAVYVDGEKLYGSTSVPSMAISQVSIMSGGIPAEYGDLSGGAIIITTQNYYTGMAAQQRMYTAAEEKAAADSAAALEKSGKRVENAQEIIEKENPEGVEQPAPQEEAKPEEKKQEAKPEENKEVEQPK